MLKDAEFDRAINNNSNIQTVALKPVIAN